MKISSLIEMQISPYNKNPITDVSGLRNTLIANCSDALSNFSYRKGLFRGFKSLNQPYLVIDSSTGVRSSQNTSNHYTLLFDNNPLLSAFPKRSKSFICTTDRSDASSYGKVYALFPFNGTKIGICPGGDFWGIDIDVPALGLKHNSIETINTVMKRYLRVPDSSFEALYDEIQSVDFVERYNQFASVILDIDQNVPWFVDSQIFKPLSNPTTLVSHLFECMSPDKLQISLEDISDFSSPIGKECWFSGQCVAIRNDTYNKLIEDGLFDDILKGGR